MAVINPEFPDRAAHRTFLASRAILPEGFRCGTTELVFTPVESQRAARMRITLLVLDRPTASFAAVFTRNAFPGAPVLVGRRRLSEPALGALVINNKVANVCAPGGVEAAEAVCAGAASLLGLQPHEVMPSSTGVIGWRLPVADMLRALPAAVDSLSCGSALPAAEAIMTTDLYPKVRAMALDGGRITGIAKGAGMIEPNLATMLVFLMTDLDVPREALREILRRVADATFNCLSIDGDTSTSDTVVLLSSRQYACADLRAFEKSLLRVCAALSEDIVRNGEGVRHVIRVRVVGAPDEAVARRIGKAVVNAPLFKCAVAGNDANVGRLVQAIGKHVGLHEPTITLDKLRASIGGHVIFENGQFHLDPGIEAALTEHLRAAELYASRPSPEGVFAPPIDYPPHSRCVEVLLELGLGQAESTVLGADLTHEYVSENADYRS